MANLQSEGVKQLVVNGLQAVEAATEAGKESAAKILEAASHPVLKEELVRGTAITSTWRQRVEMAQQAMGDAGSKAGSKDEGVLKNLTHAAQKAVGASDNRIIDAIYRTGKEIIERAEDSQSRDLGIVATGQLALHYYVAAFGTLASYADNLGNQQVAQAMKQCGDEAKKEDERHTELAHQIIAA